MSMKHDALVTLVAAALVEADGTEEIESLVEGLYNALTPYLEIRYTMVLRVNDSVPGAKELTRTEGGR